MDRSIIPQGRAETCRDCAFMDMASNGQTICCRYPPQTSTVQTIDIEPLTGKPVAKMQQFSLQPPVSMTGWCGEWKRAETHTA